MGVAAIPAAEKRLGDAARMAEDIRELPADLTTVGIPKSCCALNSLSSGPAGAREAIYFVLAMLQKQLFMRFYITVVFGIILHQTMII